MNNYIESRYGIVGNQNIEQYIQSIAGLVYSAEKVHKIPKNIITVRPAHDLESIDGTDNYYDSDYDNCALRDNVIVPLLGEYESINHNECYIYDLVDSVREYLSNVFRKEYKRVFMGPNSE